MARSVGSTWNLERRIWQHNEAVAAGGATYADTRRPVVLVYFEEYERISDAYGREKQLQNWSRKKRVALIEGRSAEAVPLSGPSPWRARPSAWWRAARPSRGAWSRRGCF